MATTETGRVFISHAYQDNDACQPLLAALASWDVDYWFQAERAEVDESLSPFVEEALAERTIFLRVCSAAAQASYWVQLETETFERLRRNEREKTSQSIPHDPANDSANDPAEADAPDNASGNASGNAPASTEGEVQDHQDEHADADDQEATDGWMLIDLSLDGSVTSDPGEGVDAHIDMTRANGLLWRTQLRRALGLVEPGIQTSEVPAVSVGEMAEAAPASVLAALPPATGDDTVVRVALAERERTGSVSAGRASSLVMLQGNHIGRVYPLQTDRVTLGRRRDSDIFLEDLAVSRHHAVLLRDSAGRFVVYDENSKNGTFVNGQSVTDHVLEDGDSIRLGQCVLQFRLPRSND